MRRIAVVMALVALVLVGCGDDGEEAVTTSAPASDTTAAPVEPFAFAVTSIDFGYELATAEVPAGPVLVTQTNEGAEAHQVTFLQLEDGQTPDALTELIATETDAALAPDVWFGGPNAVPGGESNTALVDLVPGEYVAYCFLPGHAEQGMVEPFTVTGEAPAPTTEVEPDSTVTLRDFGFEVPDGWDGQGTVAVVNEGPQPHELTINNLDGTAAGGLTAIASGSSGLIDLDLAPGDYQLVCFVADPETGQLHIQLGMQQDLTIS